MERKPFRFKISRRKPGQAAPPRFQVFHLSLGPTASVLDALEELRTRQDPTLLYRHSCHHSSCGTCACRINGTERLACITVVWDLDVEEIVLEPLAGFPCVGDLVVDMGPFYEQIPSGLTRLRESEWNREAVKAEGLTRFERLESCIECGSCVSACPVSRRPDGFIGPAGLAAISREMEKGTGPVDDLLARAGSGNGVRLCERALDCSKVCPTEVYPAGHIQKLRKTLEDHPAD